MSLIKISEMSEVPGAETGKTIHLEHPWTLIEYDLALFKAEGNFYVLTDKCAKCGGSLGKGKLRGLFAICSNQECLWNIKKGYCKFDRTSVLSTYKVVEQEDGLFINI
jgi:nitrite reductase/ring-hydroxylating ferredoxin subunit